MKKIISRGALLSLIVAVLSLLILVSGCGGSGGGFDGSTGLQGTDSKSPSTFQTPLIDKEKIAAQIYNPDPSVTSSSTYASSTSTQTPNWVFCSSSDPNSLICADDQEIVYLNGTQIYAGPGYAHECPPFSFYAQSGDKLRVVAYDVWGCAYSLWPVWLYHIPTGKSFWLTDGVPVTFIDYSGGPPFFDETFTIPEVESEISIENAKATPEKFTPSKKGENNTTNITAQIVANSFQADSIQWQVTIKDETDAIVKTFDTRTGASGSGPWDVSETWDGKNDAGDYIDFGQYSFKISATATSNGIEKKAEATGSIKIIPPIPTLKKLTFENTLDIVYDDGKKVKPVFFNAKKDKNEENPAAISLARLTPVETSVESSSQAKAFFPISKGSCNIVLELYKPDDLSGIGKHGSFTYEVQIFSKDNLLIGSDDKPKEKVYATFEKNSNKATINNG